MTEIILKATPPLSVDGFTFDLQRFDGDDNWSDYAATSFSSQNGTTITINSAEELALLAKNVNSGTTYEGYTITLGANIDLSGHNWTPIGKDDNNSFKGTFDGNNSAGYKISNLTVNSGNYVGLFGSVGTGGTVKNVTLENVNITGSSEIGGIVGFNEGTVSGCTVSGTVTGTGSGDVQVGGIVGRNYGGTVSGNTAIVTISGGKYAGGLVGYTNDKVKDNKFYSNTKYAVERDNSFNDVTNNTRYYSLTVLEGVTFTVTDGDTITDGTNTYYAGGTVTLTLTSTEAQLKDGYAFSTGDSFTITENTTVTCIPNPANHYVFGTEGNYTLATADNVAENNYPELEQVYALTLQGVTVTGDKVAKDSNGNYYAAGDITVAAKTGYTYSGSTTLTVTEDKTVSATFDTANHYVFGTEGNYTFATADNVASNNYPELKQVYALTLSDGVTVTGDTVATDSNGNYYAAGEVTLAAKTGYTISDTSLNVTEDKTITATDVWGVSGGADGSANNPYLISDVAGLQALADYVNGGGNTSNLNFKLTADINLSGVDFAPIGNYDGDTPDSFAGTFDGAYFKISNLTITGEYNVGLFGFVGEGGTIKNVTLENATINGTSNVGGLVGYNDGGTVKDCSVIGGTVSSNQYVGGLVGHNNGSVSDNTVGNVTVTATYTGDSACCGGIVGYTSGTVSGNVSVDNTINHVNNNDYVGALVGYNDTNDPINDNYYYGNADAVGYQKDSVTDGTNTRLYKLTVPEGVEVSGDNIFTFGGTTYAAGTVTLATKLGVVYSTGDSFTITEDTTITAKDLWGVGQGADGSANNPYLISDVAGLQYLADYVNGGGNTSNLNFKLNADIDLTDVDFAPIGTFSKPFKGTFDGNNKTISNLSISSTGDFVGLFGVNDGTIQNVTLTKATVTGQNYVGGLVGQNYGSTVSGKERVGGLVGSNAFGGRVENNTAITTVNGSGSPVGGVVAANGSIVTNNRFYGNQDNAIGQDVVSDSKNTKFYKLTLPEGVTASGNSFTFDGTTYAAGTVTLLSEKAGYALSIDVTGDRDLSDITVTDVWGVGQGVNGSANSPYLISDVAGLQLLAAYVNAGNDCAGLNFKLTADIDMSSVANFTAIGNYTNKNNYNPFSGTFDGADFTISNLKINSTLHYNGLFSYVGKDGIVKNVTLDNVDISGNGSLGALVGQNGGTIENCTVSGKVNGDHQVGGLTGYNTGGTVTGSKVVATVTATFTATETVYSFVGGVVGQNANSGTVGTSENPNYYHSDKGAVEGADAENNFLIYELTLPAGVEVSGALLTYGNKAYVTEGTVTFAGVKTGYVLDNTSVTVSSDMPISATVDTNGHYVFKDGETYTLATNENVAAAGYPDLTQVYELTLPEGVTAEGDIVATADGKTYAAGSVTFTGAKTGYVIDDVNVTQDTSISAIFDTANHYVLADDTKTLATAANTTDYPNLVQVYELTLPSGVTASGDTVITIDGKTYAAGSVTFAGVKTGYVINDVNVTQDTTVTATVDPTNHYAFNNGNGYTYATNSNVGSYPNLVQVYELTVPDSLKVTGDTVATANGKTYAAGSVTFTAADGYTVTSITVNGETLDGKTFTVNAATEISAESSKSINGGKGVEVGGTTGDLSGNKDVYSITASQENSTLTGNGKNNTVILTGGGENILTGGGGNDTYKFESGGGIVTDFGIGATKSGDGNTLPATPGSDVLKVDGKVSGVYFDRDASSKKSAKFTAVVTYGSGDDNDTQIIVLQNINKKPTKTGSKPTYQTNDVAAATLKIWDTSGSKQAVLSASKLKKLFHDDSDLSADLLQQVASLGKLDGIGDLNLPAVDALNQNTQATYSGDNG